MAKKENPEELKKDLTATAEVSKDETTGEEVEVKHELEEVEEEMYGFFETEAEEIASTGVVEDFKGDENLYAPNLDHEKAVNREYKSTIRFVKNPRKTKVNELKNIISKYVCWIPNPNKTDSKIMVDDASAWADQNNILTNAFFELYRSKNLAHKNMAQANFGRKLYHFSLVQIINDVQEPDLNGKMKVLRFATQVDEIINKALVNDPKNEIYAKLYSDLIKGHKFVLNIDEKEVDNKSTGGKMTITNYDGSRFSDASSSLQVEGVPEDWAKSKEGMKQMFNYLLENVPVLENYAPKKWDKETEENIIESIRLTINDPQLFDKIYMKTYGKSYWANGEPKVMDLTKKDADAIPTTEAVKEFESIEEEENDALKIDDDDITDINLND